MSNADANTDPDAFGLPPDESTENRTSDSHAPVRFHYARFGDVEVQVVGPLLDRLLEVEVED